MNEHGDTLSLVGQTIADKYVVEAVVANGGMSVVYRAQHRIWREPVAIKCFTALSSAPIDARDSLLESFIREGKVMSQLSSQTAAVVQARDIGSLTLGDGRWVPYMVLEWLDGMTLAQALDNELAARRPPRDLREALLVLESPMHALALAHALGIAHLDIKPDNLFVCGEVLSQGVTTKILDFGVAKVLDQQSDDSDQLNAKLISTATPDYAAPEQYDPVYGPTGPSTDVFAMALVLLEVLRGGVPVLAQGLSFDLEGYREMRERSTRRDLRPTPRNLGLKVSDAVEDVFAQALAVDTHQRFADVAAFTNALRLACALPQLVVRAGNTGEVALARAPVHVARPRSPRVDVAVDDWHERERALPASAVAVSGQTPPRSTSPRYTWAGAAAVFALASVAGMVWWFNGHMDDGPRGAKVVAASLVEPAKPELRTPSLAPAVVAALPAGVEPCPSDMALIPGGKFFMGSDSADEHVLAYSRPAHQVEVPAYCLDIYEVTVDQYRECLQVGECKRAFLHSYWPKNLSMSRREWQASMRAHSELCNENRDDRGNHPINCVTWQQARDFCAARGKALPTEVQWEFAARGSDGRIFPWGDEDPDATRINGCGRECTTWRANHRLSAVPALYDVDDGFVGTAPVGTFAAGKTQHGVHDIIGNVFEWTQDAFIPYEGAPPETRVLFFSGEQRSMRGGAFNSSQVNFANPALRFGQEPMAHSHGVGFRCAKPAQH